MEQRLSECGDAYEKPNSEWNYLRANRVHLFCNIILGDEIYKFSLQKGAKIKAWGTLTAMRSVESKRVFPNFPTSNLKNINASIPAWQPQVSPSASQSFTARGRGRFEVSEGLSQAFSKVTTPSKRSGLHKRTFYDSASQTCGAGSSKRHASGEAGRGWKFQCKIGERMERERHGGGAHERQSKPSKFI